MANVNYDVSVCGECLEQVDFDETCCPRPCPQHRDATIEKITLQIPHNLAEFFLKQTRVDDERLAEAIRAGHI